MTRRSIDRCPNLVQPASGTETSALLLQSDQLVMTLTFFPIHAVLIIRRVETNEHTSLYLHEHY